MRSKATATINARLGCKFSPRLRLAIKIYNLMDVSCDSRTITIGQWRVLLYNIGSIAFRIRGSQRHLEAGATMNAVAYLTALKLEQAIHAIGPDSFDATKALLSVKLLCLDAHAAGVVSQEELFALFTAAESRQMLVHG